MPKDIIPGQTGFFPCTLFLSAVFSRSSSTQTDGPASKKTPDRSLFSHLQFVFSSWSSEKAPSCRIFNKKSALDENVKKSHLLSRAIMMNQNMWQVFFLTGPEQRDSFFRGNSSSRQASYLRPVRLSIVNLSVVLVVSHEKRNFLQKKRLLFNCPLLRIFHSFQPSAIRYRFCHRCWIFKVRVTII